MATTTPSHAILGFTSHLRESLILSRSKVETWVEHEKAQADAVYERSKQTRASHQHRIDQALTNLLALQLEGGLAVSETESTTKKEKNLAARKEELLREQEAVESEIASLAKKQAQRKAQLQGTYSQTAVNLLRTILSVRTLDRSRGKVVSHCNHLCYHRIKWGTRGRKSQGAGDSRTQAARASFETNYTRRLDQGYC
jgi:primase-polymerase (primpol)-like protein